MRENKDISELWYPIPPYAVELFTVGFGLWRGRIRRLSTDVWIAFTPDPGVRGMEAAKQWAKKTVEKLENSKIPGGDRMSYYVEVKVLASGQPRPYADHDYIQELIFTRDDGRLTKYLEKNNLPKIVPQYVDREQAHAIARVYCPYVDFGSEGDDWAQRHLVSFERLEPTMHQMSSPGWSGPLTPAPDKSDRWKIHVRAAFTD